LSLYLLHIFLQIHLCDNSFYFTPRTIINCVPRYTVKYIIKFFFFKYPVSVISRLEEDVPEEAKKFSASLYSVLPRIKLTDLLMDVAYITGFNEQFTHASNNRKPDKEETIIIMAALLGMGMNIGLSKMAEATPGLTYKQLAKNKESSGNELYSINCKEPVP
jgi:hypothetical protein